MRTSYLLALMLCVLPVLISRCAAATPPSTHVTLQFIGNSCTLITAPDGTRIVSDPYGEFEHPAGMDRLPEDLKATTVTVSHAHPNHNNVEAAGGTPQLITAPGTYQVGIVKVTGYEGSPTGPSTMPHIIFVFEIRSVKVVHLGGSGPVTQPDVLTAFENADVLLANIDDCVIPSDQIIPFQRAGVRTFIPMHYSLSTTSRRFHQNSAHRPTGRATGQRDPGDARHAQTDGGGDASGPCQVRNMVQGWSQNP